MHILSKLLLAGAALLLAAVEATAAGDMVINPAGNAPLFDGRCGQEEWQGATSIELPAEVVLYLMHDEHSLYVCAKGKAEDYTVIDLYIEDTENGYLHNLHASAQLSERLLTDKEWSESKFWNQEDWSGFWVPYAGSEETENGNRTKFLQGSHREMQVLRRKFEGNSWKMMIGVSAIKHEGSFGGEFFYPEKAIDTDASTWRTFSFTE